ncbi:3-beta hydroxysteroid dehydrogenase/isomerase family protein [Lepidopterella palustris CBS 459.81]|uniref:3-beta hydroxysteroid dehydrogenase/isomerase family protein n=1 Tax=Lepidopterella palustris CBS 459.81 TaxID=1314670 RepID=A0A8E2E6Q5_9PEZI|nr:3-beta hydroxysteroid dehydrogenase/isomerase family protein [Lepidopterella palustris CBS 459.81]
MAAELVFITGAAGFLGAHLVNETLKAGYRVRGSVRKEAQAKQLETYFSPYGSMAEFVIVPDITKEEAYDGLLGDVDYIFHSASPLPSGSNDWKKDYVQPAVLGTTTILDAALKVPRIKRVIITSSIVALRPLEGLPPNVPEREINATTITLSPDYPFANPSQAYAGSKILADQATTKFMKTKTPKFSLVTIHPSFIYGRNLLQSSFSELSGTNGYLWRALQDHKPTHSNLSIHVLDVASAHLLALKLMPESDPDMHLNSWSGGIAKFLVSAQPYDWNELGEFVREKYPQVGSNIEGWEVKKAALDTGRAEEILGLKRLRTIEEMVSDVIEQQMEFDDFLESL